ncbi:CHASE domain-containing protein [Patescibacteria group bacterium]|nr:CHASE domain-containing protein [Patescibacteria group bacterium]
MKKEVEYQNRKIEKRSKAWIDLPSFTPWLTLVAGLIATFFGWQFARNIEIVYANERFNAEITEHIAAIYHRLETYEQALRSGVAFINSSNEVDRDEWKDFVENLRVRQSFPGIQGYGWSVFVRPEEVVEHTERIRAEGFPNYHIKPFGDRKMYSAIIYLEPFDERNQQAFGYDMFSQSMRRAAMEQARDTGTATNSGRVTLVQEIKGKVQAGMLMYLPVYKKHVPIVTIEDRRRAIIGFVYAPFRMDDLMRGILGNRSYLVDLHIFDGVLKQESELMYDSDDIFTHEEKAQFERDVEFKFAGRNWILSFSSTPGFSKTIDKSKQWLIVVGGVFGSLLFFGFVHGLARSHSRAVELAKQMTKDLIVSEKSTRAILDTVVNAIVTMGENRLILSFNPAAEQMFGYKADEVIGKNVNLLIPEPFHSQHDNYVEKHIETGEQRIVGTGREVIGLRKNGITFPLWLSVGTTKIDDARLFVGCMVDITERKQTEVALIAAKEAAEAANRAKSEFLNVMSHELRTPLTVILGYTPVLAKPESLPMFKKLLQKIEGNDQFLADFQPILSVLKMLGTKMDSSGKHLLTLINDLLDLSKIEAGKMILDLQSLSAINIVESVNNDLLVKAQEKGIMLVHSGSDVSIFADEIRLKQILINLVGNAIKFTDEGDVRVNVSLVNDIVEFRVSDSGCGIPEDQLDLVFAKFQQVDSSATRKKGGTGLGLAITKKLIELHGGQIRIESKMDVGSTFIFTIPSAREE